MELIRRNFEFNVRAEQNDKQEKILKGRPIVYEQKTDIGGEFAEIIDRGALDKADLKDVRFLVNHDLSKIPLARSRNNNDNSTMKLSVDDDGLKIDWVKLDTQNNADARALYSAVDRGDISGMSFMFGVAGEKWEDLESDYPTRHITKISTVIEVSAVTFPAYEQTEISVRDRSALESARKALENAKKTLESETRNKQMLELYKAKNKSF